MPASARGFAMPEAVLGISPTPYQDIPGNKANRFLFCKDALHSDINCAHSTELEYQSPVARLEPAEHLKVKNENNIISIHLNSYKYSKPRIYVQNTYPDSGITVTDYLREIAITYGPKIRSTKYNDYVNSTLSLPRRSHPQQ